MSSAPVDQTIAQPVLAIPNESSGTGRTVDIALNSCGQQVEASGQGKYSISVCLVEHFGENRVEQHGRQPEGIACSPGEICTPKLDACTANDLASASYPIFDAQERQFRTASGELCKGERVEAQSLRVIVVGK